MATLEFKSAGSDKYFQEFADFLEQHASLRGRPRLLSYTELLQAVAIRMHFGVPWRQFTGYKVHWSTVYKQWETVCRLGLLQEFFQKNVIRFRASGLIPDAKSIIIDSTTIRNLLGSEGVSKDPATHWKHRGTKMHLIATHSGIPLAVTFSDVLTHDVRMVTPTVDAIPISTRRSTLLADKGYISRDLKAQLRRRGITLLFPHRRNMPPVTDRVAKKLRQRKRIEHNFAALKRHRLLSVRMDRKLTTFKGTCHFALTLQLYAKVKNFT